MVAQKLGISHSDFWRMSLWELCARMAGHIDANTEDAADTSKDAFVAALQSGSF